MAVFGREHMSFLHLLRDSLRQPRKFKGLIYETSVPSIRLHTFLVSKMGSSELMMSRVANHGTLSLELVFVFAFYFILLETLQFHLGMAI